MKKMRGNVIKLSPKHGLMGVAVTVGSTVFIGITGSTEVTRDGSVVGLTGGSKGEKKVPVEGGSLDPFLSSFLSSFSRRRCPSACVEVSTQARVYNRTRVRARARLNVVGGRRGRHPMMKNRAAPHQAVLVTATVANSIPVFEHDFATKNHHALYHTLVGARTVY